MSQRTVKQIRRQVKKQSDKIKVEGLKQFVDFRYAHNFRGRLKIAVMILFKRVKI